MESSHTTQGRPVTRLLENYSLGEGTDARKATLLAVCPNSDIALRAAIHAAKKHQAPMLYAATLNQVDFDGGYTGWTPAVFAEQVKAAMADADFDGPVVLGLDHGGPWLKDKHRLEGLSFTETMESVKKTLTACLDAGYGLLHIDPTVDVTLPKGTPPEITTVVDRTVEMIAHAEAYRMERGLAGVDYEVGTEEVHGGLTSEEHFRRFLEILKKALEEKGLAGAWPIFVVGQVGTDLHTTRFDKKLAGRLVGIAAEYGCVLKGHYTDSVDNPEDYPVAGIGGANVGPEFTTAEFETLAQLADREAAIDAEPSGIMDALESAVEASGRWKKWLLDQEQGRAFVELAPERRQWLVGTGCRYIWSAPLVQEARQRLYANLAVEGIDGDCLVLEAVSRCIGRYLETFGLADTAA